jgi:hypothetical protein
MFRYKFSAYPAGTYWYHSHSAFQREDGFYGKLIVRQPRDVEVHRYCKGPVSLIFLSLLFCFVLIASWLGICLPFEYCSKMLSVWIFSLSYCCIYSPGSKTGRRNTHAKYPVNSSFNLQKAEFLLSIA